VRGEVGRRRVQLWGLHWHLAAVVGNDVPAAYFKMMQVALLQLLGAVYLAILSAGVGFRLCIFPARYEFDTIPRRLFQIDAGVTSAATCRILFRDNFSWRGFQAGYLTCGTDLFLSN